MKTFLTILITIINNTTNTNSNSLNGIDIIAGGNIIIPIAIRIEGETKMGSGGSRGGGIRIQCQESSGGNGGAGDVVDRYPAVRLQATQLLDHRAVAVLVVALGIAGCGAAGCGFNRGDHGVEVVAVDPFVRIAQLIERLDSVGHRLLLLGGPGDVALAQEGGVPMAAAADGDGDGGRGCHKLLNKNNHL